MLCLLIHMFFQCRQQYKLLLQDFDWARLARPWALTAWAFLTLGIALGSWWAYYELGWGGWWFWDPVENISLIPWLFLTNLLHLNLLKRQISNYWYSIHIFLSTFFTILGIFFVRSGLLDSVHSFTTDYSKGLILLVFLILDNAFSAKTACTPMQTIFLAPNFLTFLMTFSDLGPGSCMMIFAFIITSFSL